MGSVVGEKITRAIERGLRGKYQSSLFLSVEHECMRES